MEEVKQMINKYMKNFNLTSYETHIWKLMLLSVGKSVRTWNYKLIAASLEGNLAYLLN